MLKKQTTMFEGLENDQKNRLWDYKLHEEDIFYSRLNFFLIFESVLMGVVGLLFSRPHPFFTLKAIVILGLVLTILWGYVQARQLYTYGILVDFLKDAIPEYDLVFTRRKTWLFIGSSKRILTYLVPVLICLVWIAVLFLQ